MQSKTKPTWNNSTLSVSGITKQLLPKYTKVLLWVLGLSEYSKWFMILTERILSLWKENGTTFMVIYLKESSRLIHKYISGTSEQPASIRMKMKYGLPGIIPGPLRHKIMTGDSRVTRGVLTLVSIFRVAKIPGVLKLSTITDPFTGMDKTLPVGEVGWVYASKFRGLTKKKFMPYVRHELIPLVSAGPNCKTSCLGASLDALAFHREPQTLNSFIKLGTLLGSSLVPKLLQEIEVVKDKTVTISPVLGRLSIKEEAAGKVRVFAIVDVWTQSLLVCIHQFIFDILETIPQDGTFNQSRPLDSLQTKLKSRTNKEIYSFDLTAATDRLPIALQVQLLSQLLGREAAEHWAQLLVSRTYHLVDKRYGNHQIKYSVGQPMGALSSWALLAITHHFIVQTAASRAGLSNWFDDYALLGDDIVIANKAVADHYLVIMRSLGLEINLSKSLISNKGVCEFAKRLVSPEGELTPIGPKNILWCLKAPSMLISLFLDLSGKGYSLTGPQVEELFRTIMKVPIPIHKRSIDKLFWMIVGPFGIVKEHTSFGPLKVSKPLSELYLWPVLEAMKELFLLDQQKRYESTVSKCRERIKWFTSTPVNGIVEGLSPWLLPSRSSILRSLVQSQIELLEKSPMKDEHNPLLALPSFLNWTDDPGSYYVRAQQCAAQYNSHVSLGLRVKPVVPQLRDNNFKFYNKVLKRAERRTNICPI